MNFLAIFSKPTDIADLRDRCLMAETRNVLLENALEAERSRRTRERRRDATDIARAIAARAAALKERYGRLDDGVKELAIEAGKRR